MIKEQRQYNSAEKIIFPANGGGKTRHSHAKEIKFDLYYDRISNPWPLRFIVNSLHGSRRKLPSSDICKRVKSKYYTQK